MVLTALLPILLATVALIGYSSTLSALGQAQKAQKEASEAQNEEARQRELVEEERDKLNGQLLLAHMPQAQRAHEVGDLARLRTILNQHRPRPGWTDHRAWEWFYLGSLSRDEILGVRGHTSPVLAVAFSPDGKRLASADSGGTSGLGVNTARNDGFRAPVKSVRLSWAPDGRRLALVRGDGTLALGYGRDRNLSLRALFSPRPAAPPA